jgi:hypothetical protein
MGLDLVAVDPETVRRSLLGARLVERFIVEVNDLLAIHANEVMVLIEVRVQTAGLVQRIDFAQQANLDERVDVLVNGCVRNRRNFLAHALDDRLRTRVVVALGKHAVDHIALVRSG